jgi:endogenous inhibitor of DNA gyrase (YacG/DUF329 family)
MTARTSPCPTCRKAASPTGNKHFPFCCERCQLVDLGAWLSEEYRIPEPISDQSGGGAEGPPGSGEND